MPAGEPDAGGQYPDGTVNRMVADRLAELAEKSKAFDGEALPRRSRRTSRTGDD